MPLFMPLLFAAFDKNSAAFMKSVVEGAPRINEDTMPGELANVVAGRVSNLLDLQGPNFGPKP